MSNIYTSAGQLIGRTPLLELTHIEEEAGLKARVLAKLEMEDSRITIRTLHGRRIYRLPLMISPAVPTYST